MKPEVDALQTTPKQRSKRNGMSTSAVEAVASATNDCELIDRCDVISLTAVMFLELDREWGLDEVIVNQVGSIVYI